MTPEEQIAQYKVFVKLVRDYRAGEVAWRKERVKSRAEVYKQHLISLGKQIDEWTLEPKKSLVIANQTSLL